MRLMRTGRWVLGAASTLLLWAAAPGCGGVTVSSFCDKVCDCTGCTETERSECVDTGEDLRDTAADEGCSAEFDTYLSCLNSEATCVDDVIDADGCESEATKLAECAGPIESGSVATCQKVCEATQKCPDAQPVDCAPTCTNGVADIAESGCGEVYDAYLECALTIADICNPPADACLDEGTEAANCISAFCNSNPDADLCN